jgi:hypothetical protein
MAKVKTDRLGNYIGSADSHAFYDVLDFSAYPEVEVRVNESQSTESVYVTYMNNRLLKSVTVRFSHHVCNAVEFGDMLDGNIASRNEILYHLGLMSRTFKPDSYLAIATRQISNKDLSKGIYEEAPLTIQEMYALGEGADLSQYEGKLAKGSRYLIESDVVKRLIHKRVNRFGESVTVGQYEYIPNEFTKQRYDTDEL